MQIASTIQAIKQVLLPSSRPLIPYPKKRIKADEVQTKTESKKPLPRWFKPAKWGAYLTIIGSSISSAWNTVTGNWEINNLAALARVTTKASGETIPSPPVLFGEYALDAFIGNHVSFDEIKNSLIQAGIQPQMIDLNQDHIVANTSEEAEKLAQELMSSSNVNLAEKLLDASKYSELIIPPRSVPVRQGEELNCFLMDEIEGLPDQFKKGMVRVIEFDKDSMDMKIAVKINGKEFLISRLGEDGINEWISSSFDASSSGEHLLVPLITLAAEKAFNEQKLFGFISLPQKYQMWRLPPGYATLLTGKPHSAILTKNLTKEQLRKILGNSDKTVITLAKFPDRKDITGTNTEAGLFQRLDLYYDRGHSAKKETNFENGFRGLVQKIESEKTRHLALANIREQPNSSVSLDDTCTPSDELTPLLKDEETKVEYKPKVKPFRTVSELTTNHVYRLANGQNKNVNLIEDDSRRFLMTDEDILRNFDIIVVDNEYLEHFLIGPLASSLIGLAALGVGARVVRKKLTS